MDTRAVAMLIASAIFLPLGCSAPPTTTTLTGYVTFQGKPVTVGAIYFHSPNNQMAMGVILDTGTYTATDVPIGEVRVSFQIKDPGIYDQPKPDKTAKPKGVTRLPAKYADPNLSGINYTITAGMTTLDVKVE